MAEQGPISQVSGGKPRVLIVDDDLSIARALQRVLSDEFEVVALSSPVEAVHLVLAGRRFSAIVCDIRMPELTGMDLHAEIARLSPRQAARMLFTTGGGLPAKLQAFADEQGAMNKPMNLVELRKRVGEIAARG